MRTFSCAGWTYNQIVFCLLTKKCVNLRRLFWNPCYFCQICMTLNPLSVLWFFFLFLDWHLHEFSVCINWIIFLYVGTIKSIVKAASSEISSMVLYTTSQQIWNPLWTTDWFVCENPDKSALKPENMCHHYRNWWNFTCLLVNNHEHTFHPTCDSSLLPGSHRRIKKEYVDDLDLASHRYRRGDSTLWVAFLNRVTVLFFLFLGEPWKFRFIDVSQMKGKSNIQGALCIFGE